MSKIYDKKLLKKLADRLNKPEKYIREQVSKRAGSLGVMPETFFVLWLIQNKIAVTRYIKTLEPDIRAEIQQHRSLTTRVARPAKSPAHKAPRVTIKKKDLPKAISQLLPQKDVDGAAANAAYYPYIYLLENSTRKFIAYFLEKEYGKNWWTHSLGNKAVVRRSIKKDVEYLKDQEARNPIHTVRGASDLDYTDFKHLATIIEDNRDVFDPVCLGLPGDSTFISQVLRTLAPSRNTLSHMGVISKRDGRRIIINWEDALSAYKRISSEVININKK